MKSRRSSSASKKYKPSICSNAMTFSECEMAVLRNVVDESEKIQGAKIATSPEVQQMIQILEDFLLRKKLICYGGTAINNILPKHAQFYNRSVEIPDYDFFSPNALRDAKELADVYYSAGYSEVEAKSGMHPGTYKVYVNFLPVADITQLHPVLFESIKRESISVAGIKYAPPNYLRMSMFLELSRPNGDVSRWEKVLKRINLLNAHYPLSADVDCNQIDFQRKMDVEKNQNNSETIYFLVRDSFIDQGLVFLGGYGVSLYSKYMPHDQRRQVSRIPDFDVLSENPEKSAMIVRDRLVEAGYKQVKLVQHTPLGEVIPAHIEISVNGDVIGMIYQTIACHSYNKITIGDKEINVASIDTMLSFYLAFVYANKPYFNKDRILCMAMYLFQVQQKNSLEQKGLLKRFSIDCYGKQETMEEIRAEKARKYEELKSDKSAKGKKEMEIWFLKYNPSFGKKPKNRKVLKSVGQKEMVDKTITLKSFTKKGYNRVGESSTSSSSSASASASASVSSSKSASAPASASASSPIKKEKTRKFRQTKKESGPYAKRVFYFGKPK